MPDPDHQPDPPVDDDQAIEREILEHRKFSWEEAIARQAGKDLMKGASPVSTKQQAELQIEKYLRENLPDAERALRIVLDRRVTESEVLFERGYEQPLVALAMYVEGLLASDGGLEEFVREVDAEWGQLYGERPYFQRAGSAAHPDDPYSIAAVHGKLAGLHSKLRGE